MADLSIAPKNHNNPPSEIEMLEEALILRHVTLVRQGEEHVTTAAQIPDEFAEEIDATFVTELIGKMQTCVKDLEKNRKEEKDPYWQLGLKVDNFFNSRRDQLNAGITKANKPLGLWLKKKAEAEEERRRADAEALRIQAEKAIEAQESQATVTTIEKTFVAAEKAASAPIQTMAASYSGGSTSTLKEEWVGTITDLASLDLNALRSYIGLPALQVALNAYVKAGNRTLAGAQITKEFGVKTR